MPSYKLAELWRGNRAGPEETTLSEEGVLLHYCRNRPEE